MVLDTSFWQALDNWMAVVTSTSLLVQTLATYSKVSCASNYRFMKNILLCMLGQSISGIVIALYEFDLFHLKDDEGSGWKVLTVFGVVHLIYWVSIYMTTWLVAFKYYETSSQMETMDKIVKSHETKQAQVA